MKDSRFVNLKVFDLTGREVATLVNQRLEPGTYEVRFDANDLSSGIYFYQLKTDDFSQTKKFILLK
ncbi:MAG: T9SS type A sorting domain-containing protein [Ignavibacteria bacterium]|nr:T9SS type A sorting domain-containing protein [Ignavibacteria bacterium]